MLKRTDVMDRPVFKPLLIMRVVCWIQEISRTYALH